jgi:hypothetical protein
MGAMRTTGVKGTMLAGDVSGEQPAGARILNAAILGSSRETDLVGEHIDGIGLSEELTSSSVVSISKDAEGLGCVIPSLILLLSTIPESNDLGGAPLLPVKRSKRLSDCSEFADEVGLDSYTPEK